MMKDWPIYLSSLLVTIPLSICAIFLMIIAKGLHPFETIGVTGAIRLWIMASSLILLCTAPISYAIYTFVKARIASQTLRYLSYMIVSCSVLTLVFILSSGDVPPAPSDITILHPNMTLAETYFLATPYIVIFWTCVIIFEFIQSRRIPAGKTP